MSEENKSHNEQEYETLYRHWVVLSERGGDEIDMTQSKAHRYRHLIHQVCDSFTEAKELFWHQVQVFDDDGVIESIIDDLECMRSIGCALDVLCPRSPASQICYTISTNCFELKNPNDRYFFEIVHINENTGLSESLFYMQLSPAV